MNLVSGVYFSQSANLTICKHPRCTRSKVRTCTHTFLKLHSCRTEQNSRWGSVREMCTERTRCHPFEPKGERTINHARFYCKVRLVEGGATSRAIIVDIRDWDASQAKVIERALRFDEQDVFVGFDETTHLATGRVSIAVSNKCSFNRIICDTFAG